jgi:hypothetical protein
MIAGAWVQDASIKSPDLYSSCSNPGHLARHLILNFQSNVKAVAFHRVAVAHFRKNETGFQANLD